MALGTPTHLGAVFAATATAAQTVSGITAAVGDLVVVSVTDDGSGSNYAITDSGGNSWTQIGSAQKSADNYNLWVFYSVLTHALSGGTITSTKSGGTGGVWDRHVSVEKLTGSGLTVDKVAQAVGGSGTAWSSGSTATTAAAAEVVFGIAADGGAGVNSSPGSGFTELYDSGVTNASTFADLYVEHKTVAATGAQAATGTWSNADVWAATCFTVMESGGSTPLSATRALSYDVANSLSATRALSYDVQASVAATRALAYDVLAALVATRALSYDVINALAATIDLSYDVLEDLASGVSAERALSYDVQGSVVATRALAYDVFGAVSATRALSYDVENFLSATRALSYDVFASVAASRALYYDVGDVEAPAGAARGGLLWVW